MKNKHTRRGVSPFFFFIEFLVLFLLVGVSTSAESDILEASGFVWDVFRPASKENFSLIQDMYQPSIEDTSTIQGIKQKSQSSITYKSLLEPRLHMHSKGSAVDWQNEEHSLSLVQVMNTHWRISAEGKLSTQELKWKQQDPMDTVTLKHTKTESKLGMYWNQSWSGIGVQLGGKWVVPQNSWGLVYMVSSWSNLSAGISLENKLDSTSIHWDGTQLEDVGAIIAANKSESRKLTTSIQTHGTNGVAGLAWMWSEWRPLKTTESYRWELKGRSDQLQLDLQNQNGKIMRLEWLFGYREDRGLRLPSATSTKLFHTSRSDFQKESIYMCVPYLEISGWHYGLQGGSEMGKEDDESLHYLRFNPDLIGVFGWSFYQGAEWWTWNMQMSSVQITGVYKGNFGWGNLKSSIGLDWFGTWVKGERLVRETKGFFSVKDRLETGHWNSGNGLVLLQPRVEARIGNQKMRWKNSLETNLPIYISPEIRGSQNSESSESNNIRVKNMLRWAGGHTRWESIWEFSW